MKNTQKGFIVPVVVLLGVLILGGVYFFSKNEGAPEGIVEATQGYKIFEGESFELQYPEAWAFEQISSSDTGLTRFSSCANEFFDQPGPGNEPDTCVTVSLYQQDNHLTYFSEIPESETGIVTKSTINGNEVIKIFRPDGTTLSPHDTSLYLIKSQNNQVMSLTNTSGLDRDSNEHQAKEAEVMDDIVSTFTFLE